MLKRFGLRFNSWFDRHLLLSMMIASVIGCTWTEPLAASRHWVPWLFAYMTLITSLRCSWSEFKAIARRPGPILLILALLHVLMPLVALGLGQLLLSGRTELIAGLVLIGAIPIGVTSAIWTGLAAGDVPLALTAVTVDTILSPILVPAVILLFLGHAVEIDHGRMITDLLKMIVLPSMIGLTIHDCSREDLYEKAIPLLGPFSRLSLAAVIGINVATIRITMAGGGDFGIASVVIVVSILVGSGFFLGWLAPFMLGYTREQIAATVYSIGIRNLSAGLVIAMGHFPPMTVLPVILGMLFQQPGAALARAWLERRARQKPREEDFP